MRGACMGPGPCRTTNDHVYLNQEEVAAGAEWGRGTERSRRRIVAVHGDLHPAVVRINNTHIDRTTSSIIPSSKAFI